MTYQNLKMAKVKDQERIDCTTNLQFNTGRNRHRGHWNRVESPDISPRTFD